MKVVICDDNRIEREKNVGIIKTLAQKYDIEVAIAQYSSGEQLLFEYDEPNNYIDILFLDINMLKVNGIEAAKRLREYNCTGEIVFLTHSEQHMLQAFDVKALNYIIKSDNNFERFESVFLQAVEAAGEKEKEYIRITGVGEARNIAINSIKYFEIIRKIVIVHYNREEFEFISTLEKLEKLLFSKGFVRVHRSFLVSAAYVESYSYEQLKMTDGSLIPVGRKYYQGLKEKVCETGKAVF